MKATFYKYTSATKPQIDPYLIYMALGVWSWYWIILDTVVLTFIIGSILLIQSFSWLTLLVLAGIISLCLMIMKNIKDHQCRKYALLEVQAIFDLPNSRDEITRYIINAL